MAIANFFLLLPAQVLSLISCAMELANITQTRTFQLGKFTLRHKSDSPSISGQLVFFIHHVPYGSE